MKNLSLFLLLCGITAVASCSSDSGGTINPQYQGSRVGATPNDESGGVPTTQPYNLSYNSTFPIVLSWSERHSQSYLDSYGFKYYEIQYTIYPPSSAPITDVGTSTNTNYTFRISQGQYSGGELVAKVRVDFQDGSVSDWSNEYNMTLY